MDIAFLSQKRVGILGYGREGQSVARYLDRHGIVPVLFDKNTEINPGKFISHTGSGYLGMLSEVDVIFRSPGFWRLDPALLAFEKNGGTVTSQTAFFFDNCPAPIIGVTGTKGKGTTTSLIHEMAVGEGKKSYLTGNIGTVEPLEFLDLITASDLVCYELSSFQLQDLKKSPHISVVLMTTADHLDHHADLSEYHQAKTAITAFQKEADFAIINKDFPASVKIGQQGNATKLWVSSSKVSFGIVIHGGSLSASGTAGLGIPEGPLLRLNELVLRGEHNLQNVAAALLAGASAGLSFPSMLATAKLFRGLEHRLELAAEKNGVKFYNDSYSTTPETAMAAIASFEEPLFLMLGGSEKFLDYSALAAKIARAKNIAGIFLLGETAGRMTKTLEEASVLPEKILSGAATLEEMFSRLHFLARPGDVVLLSPATASFGMFKNYKERGEKFKQLAKDW